MMKDYPTFDGDQCICDFCFHRFTCSAAYHITGEIIECEAFKWTVQNQNKEGNKMEGTEKETDGMKAVATGAFIDSLKRNNKQIRADRADAIGEDAEVIYKRKVEDLELRIKKMRREQENMLDLSPTNAQSLIVASDFDAEAYATKDLELGVAIRNEEIKLEIAKRRYAYLFGGGV
jgi:hypothetical protein